MTTTMAAPLDPESTVKKALASLWWMPLIRGILLILFGILMVARPGSTLLNVLWFMGFYWIVDGLFGLIEGIRGRTERSRTWMIISSIASTLGGFFIVNHPALAGWFGGTLLVNLIGIVTLNSGILLIFAGRDGHWTWGGLLMGTLYVLFGLFILANPMLSLSALIWTLGIWAVIAGFLAIGLAFNLRRIAQ